MSREAKTVLGIKGLELVFRSPTGDVHAIRGLDIKLCENEVLALVGESGCGKSVAVKSIMGILPGNAVIEQGEILFHDGSKTTDLLKMKESFRRKNINGSKIAMVFQDPMTSLNPTMTIGAQLITALRSHRKLSKLDAYARGVELLREVGMTDPRAHDGAVPASAFGRYAAESSHSDSALAGSEAADMRRAHNSARCHDTGKDTRPSAKHTACKRSLGDIHNA